MSFEVLGLQPEIIKALHELGYVAPTKIQAEVLPVALKHKHIVGQAQTGSGKTAAFVLPILQHVNHKKWYPQALIIAPTRELVNQIREEVFVLSKYMKIRSVSIYGGISIYYQKEQLERGPQIIIATPGRLMQFMRDKLIDPKKISYFVLDEVDRMLDMGFIEDIETIRSQLTELKQTYLFSATISPEITKIIHKHLQSYEHIKAHEEITVETIDHSYIYIQPSQKIPTLQHLLHEHVGQKTIIFTQTKKNTDILSKFLIQEGLKVNALHGGMDQRTRNIVLREYKNDKIDILVTTDVAARGLNLRNIEVVINFDVPHESESYIHRIGRTGRAGAHGKAIMFVTPDERSFLTAIEKNHTGPIKRATYTAVDIPHGTDAQDLDLDMYRSKAKKSSARRSTHTTSPTRRTFIKKDRMAEIVAKRYAGDDYTSYGNEPDEYRPQSTSSSSKRKTTGSANAVDDIERVSV